ncbi:hypothetical protein HY643_01915, partial [Candidatus Woesearchaeota archaeon]|nr:hypothetical protein [Candidatus Woesearchaeota archaeon]
MGLENVFGTVEKPEEEKKLQVVVSDESVVDELMARFEQSLPSDLFDFRADFDFYKESLKNFKISPEQIRKFNEKNPEWIRTFN